MKNFYIEQLADGKVRYRMAYQDPLTNKTKRVTVTYDHDSVRNRRKASEELSEKVDAIVSNVDRSNLPLCKVVEDYHAYMQKTLKSSTTRRNIATIGRLARDFPKETLLPNITTALWKARISELSENVPSTYNEYATRLKSFLRWCYQNDYLKDINIIEKISRVQDAEKRWRIADKYLEPDEISELLDHMKETQWHLLTEFMILSGVRVGEAAALTWSDIGTEYITVNKNCDFLEGKATTTKTIASARQVSIQKELAECLENIREYNKFFCASNRIKSDLIFPSADGDYMHYYAFNKYLREIAEKCLTKKVTTHTLRHTHVSLLFAAGVPLDVISRRVGHEDSKITKAIYLHITEKVKKTDAEIIQDIKLL